VTVGDPRSGPLADPSQVEAWMRHAIASAGRELDTIYGDLAVEITARSPRCSASGRCCKFESFGHRLYVTGLEAAYLWARLGLAARPSLTDVSASRAAGGCPFQPERLCTVHAIRPMGCRMFFCDETAKDWQEATYERYQSRIRELHDRLGIPYIYAEWRALLELLATSGVSSGWPTFEAPAVAPPPNSTGDGTVLLSIRGEPRRDLPS
jgi:Fe-S-cluster containining protein